MRGSHFPCFGGATDGHYVYLAPYATGNQIARFDLDASFTDTTGGWSFFVPVDNTSKSFAGALYDGRFVDFLPRSSNLALVRLDPQLSPSDGHAWSTFSPRGPSDSGSPVYAGGAFDGRSFYVAPQALSGGGVSGNVSQLDTGSGAWQTFDTQTLVPPAADFLGAVFDGEYVYFVPETDGVFARFHARSPAALPPGWGASSL